MKTKLFTLRRVVSPRLFNIFVVQGAFVEILEQFFDGASIKDDWNPTSTGTILR